MCQTHHQRVLRMAEEFKERLTGMIAHWIRVGFCQGNFNADNCLVGGRTMDYGPFGALQLHAVVVVVTVILCSCTLWWLW